MDRHRRRPTARAAALVGLLIFAGACSGTSDDPDTGAGTSTGPTGGATGEDVAGDLTGTWSGATSQGGEISFEVDTDRIISVSIDFETQGPSDCTVLNGTLSDELADTLIVDGAFEIPSYQITGSFDTGTTASGEAAFGPYPKTDLMHECDPFSITWTAEKG